MHQLSQVQRKEALYNNLEQIIQTTSSSDKFIILGGFNARVDTDSDNCNRVLEDTRWENKITMAYFWANMLNSTCASQTLCCQILALAPTCNICHSILYQWDIKRCHHVIQSAECWIHHKLVWSVLSLHITHFYYKQPRTESHSILVDYKT